ncbi:MAG: hypothetical protein VZS44_00160 [Bacilli bacterium]|nr:hypothetical protein [Bacilli bacterium]
MKFIDENKLPVEIKDNQMPKDENKNFEMFYDYRVRTSGGFTDALFLAAIMVTCFMWGMLIILSMK